MSDELKARDLTSRLLRNNIGPTTLEEYEQQRRADAVGRSGWDLRVWVIEHRRGWWDIRVWSPRIWKWVFYACLFPPRVKMQRVLTRRESDEN